MTQYTTCWSCAWPYIEIIEGNPIRCGNCGKEQITPTANKEILKQVQDDDNKRDDGKGWINVPLCPPIPDVRHPDEDQDLPTGSTSEIPSGQHIVQYPPDARHPDGDQDLNRDYYIKGIMHCLTMSLVCVPNRDITRLINHVNELPGLNGYFFVAIDEKNDIDVIEFKDNTKSYLETY